MQPFQQPIIFLALLSKETLAIPFVTRMEQNNVKMCVNLKSNSINPDPLKHQGPPKFRT